MGEAEKQFQRLKTLLVSTVQALVNAVGHMAENGLNELHQDDQENNRHQQHGGIAALVAVPDSQVAQAARADGACDGG